MLLSEKAADSLYTLSLYFEAGHLDTLNFGTLFQAINELQEVGMENIENQINQLALKAKQAFSDRNLLSPAVTGRKDHSPIFNLMLPETKVKELQAHHIPFSSKGAGIRVSFHFYNSENALDKLLQLIDR